MIMPPTKSAHIDTKCVALGKTMLTKAISANEAVSVSFDDAAKRLNHILDKIGLSRERGRGKALHELLQENYQLSNLSYSSVRSWLQSSSQVRSPSIEHMGLIIEILSGKYRFSYDEKILSWWKSGGDYPDTSLTTGTTGTTSNTKFDMSGAIAKDPIFVSQIILKIEELRKKLGVTLDQDAYALINGRIVAFCLKNQYDSTSCEAQTTIDRMLLLHKDNLLL